MACRFCQSSRSRQGWRLAFAVLVAGLVQCERTDGDERASKSPEPTAAPAPPPAQELTPDAAVFETAVDPPAPPGDLRADIEGFTTLDACVIAHARIDPLVGEAMQAIGYDTLVRDACRGLEAAKAHDATRCAAIDASPLRNRCVATVAQVTGNPDGCPWTVADRPALGREPFCVAVAARDARLCAGASRAAEQATCLAVVTHDNAACAGLSWLGDQNRCIRSQGRWATLFSPVSGRAATATGKLHLEGQGAPIDVDLGPDLAQGVVLQDQRGGLRFVLGPLTLEEPDRIAPSPQRRATFALEVAIPLVGSARVDQAQLLLPGRAPMATPLARSTLTVKAPQVDRARGGRLEVAVDGDFVDATASWKVHAVVSTFVRDLVRAADAYAARLGGPAPPQAGRSSPSGSTSASTPVAPKP